MIDFVGQRVQLRYARDKKGTVARICPGWFTVVYDFPERKTGESRERYVYHELLAANFEAETFTEIRILEDDETDENVA